MTRSQTLVLVTISLCIPARAAEAQVDDRAASRDSRHLMTPETRSSIDEGLIWLAGRQQEDGSFGTTTRYRNNPGVAGLCGLAFLASGSTPDRGPYGQHVSRAIDFVLSCARPSGYIVEEDWNYYHGPMYGHGFATLFLAEVYGMSPRDEVRETLRRAVTLIVNTQNEQGGWRYVPESEEADISVTVCQVMALRAARNAGIAVPKETIDACIDYLQKSQNGDGGFRYRLLEAAESKFPRSAAALVALYTSGVYEGPIIERGLGYMMQFAPGTIGSRSQEYYFYGQYYAVQAAWHAGGDYWEIWYPAARDELLDLQLGDGSWSDPWIGNEYAAAMSLIALQLPNNYLPIFER
ncbi:MAG: prenyltransferase [Planctomycetota bacterium]|nr:MAG: prenyltransferase [Planctomycetota bacterium]REJ96500.1 MAG: prenyltransferase [Planctomycetota bacterium]REK24747.1 MAG: prenyltransferase [Planctomycetota bacterium]REK37815.1 MAG: prenyltransferase [Planctomycetota bacterium]